MLAGIIDRHPVSTRQIQKKIPMKTFGHKEGLKFGDLLQVSPGSVSFTVLVIGKV